MLKTTVKIDGMMCGMCEAHISDVIRKTVPGAKKVSASHTRGEASFLSEEPADEGRLRDAINKTGYTFQSMTATTCEKKGLFGWK